MDYDQVRENLNDLIKKCPFIFVKDQGQLVENDFDGEVEDFENRNLDVSQNLKKWSDLDLDEKKALIDYFSSFDQSDDEKLLVQDLVLYTMEANYYEEDELVLTPSEANAKWRLGFYSQWRADGDEDEHELNVAFKKLKEMVEAQVSKDTPQKKATRALRKAVLGKDVSKVVDAINNGADPNVYITTNNKGLKLTALGASVLNMEPKIVKALLDANADIILKREDGSEVSALDLAKQVKEKHPDQAAKCDEIIEMLQKAEVEQKQKKVNEALVQAVKEGSLKKVQEALKEGADISYKVNDKTVLQQAEELMKEDAAKYQPIVDELKKHEAEKKRQKATQDLIQAIKEGSVEKAQAAVTAGADVNVIVNEAQDTILHEAVKTGNVALVNPLLVVGATDYTLKNKDGKTALDLARELLQKEADPAKKAQYEAIVASLEKAAGITTAQAEVKFPNKAPETTWEAWYAEGAQHWDEKVSQLIATLSPEEQKNPESNPTVKLYMEIKSHYAALHETEVKRNKETNKAEKKRLATQMLATIKKLNDSEESAVVTKLSDAEKSNLVKASDFLQEELKSLEREHKKPKEAKEAKDVKVTVPPVGPTIVDGPGGRPGTSQPGVGETGGTGMGTDKEKAKVALAEAKHDGSQEKKGFWERNQEWIWWVLGIIAAGTLAFFAFRKGGWLNKDKKSSSSSAVVNSNSNSNSNNNSNTGNDNTNTNTGGCNSDCICNNTNNNTDNSTGVDNTLQNSGKLYSAKEANDIIASNLTQLFTKEK